MQKREYLLYTVPYSHMHIPFLNVIPVIAILQKYLSYHLYQREKIVCHNSKFFVQLKMGSQKCVPNFNPFHFSNLLVKITKDVSRCDYKDDIEPRYLNRQLLFLYIDAKAS